VLLLVGGLLGVELLGRAILWFKYGVAGKSYGIYQADEELGATHRPHSYNSNTVLNNLGLRNREDTVATKPAGALRFYCSGGSTTYCYNLPADESWPQVFQDKLRRLPGHAADEVLNAGQICFSTAHEFILARRLVPHLKPDYVILFPGVNEGLNAERLAQKDGVDLDELLTQQRWGVASKSFGQANFWLRHSVLARFWDYKIKTRFEQQAVAEYRRPEPPNTNPPPEALHPWVLANLERTLRDYLGFLRDQGCKVIVIRFGDNDMESWYLRQGIRVWRDRAVEVARECGANLCDVASVVDRHPERESLFIESGVHVTASGAELVAEELRKTVLGETGK
jgi:lysophospholipase L1-like esterase